MVDDDVVGEGDYAPLAQDALPPAAPIDHPDALADREGRGHGGGERMPIAGRRRAGRPVGDGGRRALARRVNVMAHQPPPYPLCPSLLSLSPFVFAHYLYNS